MVIARLLLLSRGAFVYDDLRGRAFLEVTMLRSITLISSLVLGLALAQPAEARGSMAFGGGGGWHGGGGGWHGGWSRGGFDGRGFDRRGEFFDHRRFFDRDRDDRFFFRRRFFDRDDRFFFRDRFFFNFGFGGYPYYPYYPAYYPYYPYYPYPAPVVVYP